MALPNNNIPRLFINTGIEYQKIVEYVKCLAQKDKRIILLNSNVNIKQMLEQYGYPFKSKEHSLRVEQFNKNSNGNFIAKYMRKTNYNGKYLCPIKLLYQFEERGKYNYSNKCCYKLKKEPAHNWAKQNKKSIILTGMRKEEGGNRERLNCTIFNKGKLQKFHPLIVVNEEWENAFLENYNIKLCELYYAPYNFKRTGCKGCPFSLELQEQLDIMKKYLPNEKKQCEIIFKPVYEEYRRIGYRLRKYDLFDFLEEREKEKC